MGDLPAVEADVLGVPFEQHETVDTFGRTIAWYLSPQPPGAGSLPVALWIGGSGGQSEFERHDSWIGSGFAGVLLDVVGTSARVMVVEKPGVEFGDRLDRPGTAIGASDRFLQEHTLPRWVEANRAALAAALARPDIDPSRVLAVGHSEGGQVVCALAAVAPVTHVASLAGGGPSQLFDLVESAWAPRGPIRSLTARQARVDEIYAAWHTIESDPDALTLWWGHPYRRWSSFLADSPLDNLRESEARVYLAYGTKDRATPPVSGDLMAAELDRLGRDVTTERRLGESHGFSRRGQSAVAGFREIFSHILVWWLS